MKGKLKEGQARKKILTEFRILYIVVICVI